MNASDVRIGEKYVRHREVRTEFHDLELVKEVVKALRKPGTGVAVGIGDARGRFPEVKDRDMLVEVEQEDGTRVTVPARDLQEIKNSEEK